jgi:hypothetical protein
MTKIVSLKKYKKKKYNLLEEDSVSLMDITIEVQTTPEGFRILEGCEFWTTDPIIQNRMNDIEYQEVLLRIIGDWFKDFSKGVGKKYKVNMNYNLLD